MLGSALIFKDSYHRFEVKESDFCTVFDLET